MKAGFAAAVVIHFRDCVGDPGAVACPDFTRVIRAIRGAISART